MAAKITVRELITKLTIGGNAGDKLAKFGLQMNGIKAGLGLMVGVMKLASKATIGLVDDITKIGDGIAKMAGQTGVAAKALQRLSFTADRSGASMRGLRKGLQNIQKNLRDAEIAAGKGKGTGFTAALAEIGLRFKDLQDLSPEKQLGLLGDALNSVTDKGRRMALSQKLLGERSGPNLAQLLAEGTEGIKKLGDEAERLGLVMGDKALKASEAFQDRMTDLRAVLKGLKTTIGVALIPIVEKAVKKFTEWLLLNRKFITGKFEKGVKFLTKAFAGLVDNLDGIVDAFGDMADLSMEVLDFFRSLADAVGGLDRLIVLAAAAWGTYRIAMLAATVGLSLTPLGLAATALGLIAAGFLLISKNARMARIENVKFNKGRLEDEPVDEDAVRMDAAAVADSLLNQRRLDPFTRARLEETSKQQLAQTMKRAKDILDDPGKVIDRSGRSATSNFMGLDTSGVRTSGRRTRTTKTAKALLPQLGKTIDLERFLISERTRFAEENEGRRATSVDGGAGRSFRPVRGGGAGKADAPADKSFEELMADAIRSGQLPEAAALLTSTQPPIIITNTNINIQMDVDASMEFEGIAGESDGDLLERIREVATDVLGTEVRSAMDQLKPQLAR